MSAAPIPFATQTQTSLWRSMRDQHPKLKGELDAPFTALLLIIGEPAEEPLTLTLERTRAFVKACEEIFGITQHREVRLLYTVFYWWHRRQGVTQ